MPKCVSIVVRHELTAEFAPVRSALCFLNKFQTTRLSRAMWMIDDPHVRVEMVTLHDMLSYVLNIRTSKVNEILACFFAKGVRPVSSRIPRSMALSS